MASVPAATRPQVETDQCRVQPMMPNCLLRVRYQEEPMSLIAADIMTTVVKTARPDDTVANVAKLLADNDISAVPVCDDQGRLLGMLSEGDLLRPVGRESTARRAWWLNLLAEGTDLAPSFLESISTENQLARNLMVTPAITASADTSVPELADMLVRHHVKRLPIMRDGKLVGIVSRADLVRALARTPAAMAEAI
ncbi:MAG: CBS domain-containing protein [Rhodopila sp.]|nr:CBS domain-containing protein [Rhodopila sp.]